MFTLLQEFQLYKKVVTSSGEGHVEDGVYIPPANPVISYIPFEGEWEYYRQGINENVLPEGRSSRDAITLLTEENLKVPDDLTGNETLGDIIYLVNPTTNPNAPYYRCITKRPWLADGGFTLLPENFYEVICLREVNDD